MKNVDKNRVKNRVSYLILEDNIAIQKRYQISIRI